MHRRMHSLLSHRTIVDTDHQAMIRLVNQRKVTYPSHQSIQHSFPVSRALRALFPLFWFIHLQSPLNQPLAPIHFVWTSAYWEYILVNCASVALIKSPKSHSLHSGRNQHRSRKYPLWPRQYLSHSSVFHLSRCLTFFYQSISSKSSG